MSQYQIKINEPCHENWNAMSPKEQGRFCGVCTKDVVDFTSMTDHEVKSYFINYKGSLCGRFTETQLEQKDERYFKLTDYTKHFIKAFATIFLLISASCSSAQIIGKPVLKGDTYCASFEITHKGEIYGTDGYGIGNVALQFYQNGELKKQTTTAPNGSYSLTLKNGKYEVFISVHGFETIVTNVEVSANGTVGDFELVKKVEKNNASPVPQIMGEVRIMGAPRMVQPKRLD